MAAEITTSPAFQAGVPHELFKAPLGGGADLSADGRRLQIVQVQAQTRVYPITIVPDWMAGLRR
jgi:hypothetical protein